MIKNVNRGEMFKAKVIGTKGEKITDGVPDPQVSFSDFKGRVYPCKEEGIRERCNNIRKNVEKGDFMNVFVFHDKPKKKAFSLACRHILR